MTKSVYFRDDFIVITGGPGAGKTTLLKGLEECGYGYVPEVARDIIRKQVSINGDALPWGDKVKYRDLMLDKSIESYRLTLNESTNFLFFDRGIPDTLAYSKLISIPIFRRNFNWLQKIIDIILRYSFYHLGQKYTKPMKKGYKV
jgi:predicted ATPase